MSTPAGSAANPAKVFTTTNNLFARFKSYWFVNVLAYNARIAMYSRESCSVLPSRLIAGVLIFLAAFLNCHYLLFLENFQSYRFCFIIAHIDTIPALEMKL